ncbi:MAG: NAD+ synthase [Bdellovibrionales bacterium]|nr:NAD+ synthase [Bdellovibrionales bacterium]
MKIALAQIKTIQTDFSQNSKKIIQFAKQADLEKADIVVFPELSIPGYLALDNFELTSFQKACTESAKEIASETSDLNCILIVGNILISNSRKPYNSALVIHKGQIIASVKKTLLPEYDIFWEGRYFKSANTREVVAVDGKRIAVQICEDLWDENYEIKVTEELIEQKPDLLINISASPFHAGKIRERITLVSNAAKKFNTAFIYVNMVGAQDGYEGEVIFDGQSFVTDANGSLVSLAKAFEEDLAIVDLSSTKELVIPNTEKIVEIYHALVLGIRDYIERNGFKKVYIALSGGVDSALVCSLAVKALGSDAVTAVSMPSHITSEQTLNDAKLLAKNLGIKCELREIASLYKSWEQGALAAHKELNSITKQNIQARFRGDIMMEYTNQESGAILLTTGNKTEVALGYCTLYGDMCGGLSVIGDLSKSVVYELANFINKDAGTDLIPESIISRVPTAELELDQTDEANLPANYSILSPLVDLFVEEGISLRQAVDWLEKKGVKDPEEIARRTKLLIMTSEYKRRQMAPSIRVTRKSFGAGRRFPIIKPRMINE